MIISNQLLTLDKVMNFKIDKNIFVCLVIFFIILLANIFGVLLQDKVLLLILKPLIIVPLLLMYLNISKHKSRKLFIAFEVGIILSDILYYLNEDLFKVSMFGYILCFLILIKLIIGFKNKLNFQSILKYGLILIVPASIIYVFILRKQGATDISVILFVSSLILMLTLSLINYLNRMTQPNLILMLGCLLMVLSDAIMSMNVFNSMTEVSINLVFIILISFAHYTIAYSFMLRDRVIC